MHMPRRYGKTKRFGFVGGYGVGYGGVAAASISVAAASEVPRLGADAPPGRSDQTDRLPTDH